MGAMGTRLRIYMCTSKERADLDLAEAAAQAGWRAHRAERGAAAQLVCLRGQGACRPRGRLRSSALLTPRPESMLCHSPVLFLPNALAPALWLLCLA